MIFILFTTVEMPSGSKEYWPDAILLDIGLPGMDGYDVCRMLRADAMFSAIPIIAHTGWGQSVDKDKASEAGFSLHLTKPVGLDVLEQVLQDMVK
jgi:CheY-like chemotaxis protein